MTDHSGDTYNTKVQRASAATGGPTSPKEDEPLIAPALLEVIDEASEGELSFGQLELIRVEMTKKEFYLSQKDTCKSWTILCILLLVQVSN